MTLAEVEQLVADLDDQRIDAAYLQAIKSLSWTPRGSKVKTAFGLGVIINVEYKKDHAAVTFVIEKKKIKRWLGKAKKNEAA